MENAGLENDQSNSKQNYKTELDKRQKRAQSLRSFAVWSFMFHPSSISSRAFSARRGQWMLPSKRAASVSQP